MYLEHKVLVESGTYLKVVSMNPEIQVGHELGASEFVNHFLVHELCVRLNRLFE